MRPFTEALLRENSENLTAEGWKTDEQLRCFRKVDALLDYIGKIKPNDYVQTRRRKELSSQRVEGIKYCLEKGMPSKEMRVLSLKMLSRLLSMGEDVLVKSAWLFKHYPVLFKAKYALSPQTFGKDIHAYFVRGHFVPESSFPPFKTGENPVVSRGNAFLKKCLEMYNDSIFESSEYQAYMNQYKRSEDPYAQWRWKCRAGRRFGDENFALQRVISSLALDDAISLRKEKNTGSKQLLRKKQKTI